VNLSGGALPALPNGAKRAKRELALVAAEL